MVYEGREESYDKLKIIVSLQTHENNQCIIPMNKIFIYLTLLLIGCIAVCSCNKETLDSDNLEGTWRAYNGEILFDGKVIYSGDEAMEEYSTITFADGYMYIYSEDGVARYPYTYSNGIITAIAYIFPLQMAVKRLTKSELTLDMPVPSLESDLEGRLFTTYKGRDIYRSESYILDDTYWYVSGSKIVICTPIDEDDIDAGWADTYRIYMKK